MNAWFSKITGGRRPGSRPRGSVLVIVIGVLALMAILVTIYATLGQADRRTSTGAQQYTDLQGQVEDISNYFAKLIAADTFKAKVVDNVYNGNDPRGDTYVRAPETNPSIDPTLRTQTNNPAERYVPRYYPSDARLANQVLPPSTFVPGSILTRWNDPNNPNRQFGDPRIPFTPFVAKAEPTWLRLSNGTMPQHRDPTRPWLENRDYEIITNAAPDGRFINLAAIRNNFDAKSGVGLDLFGRFCTTYGLTLLKPNGDSTLELALPAYWPLGRTAVNWNGAANGQPPDYFPYDFTARQQGMFRRTVDARLRNQGVGSLTRNYNASLNPTTIVPGDWEYFDNQLADTNGDGIYDSRWFELRDASDPGNDGNFGTLDDVVRNLVRENGNLRIFVAAQIEDLSGKINVNTGTQFRTPPDAMNPAGMDPSHVDLERALRMADVVHFFPNASYEAFAQPRLPFVNGTASYNSNYKDSVSYNAFWNEGNRDHSVADTIGATAFSALIEARVSGRVPEPGIGWTRRPEDFFAPLSVRAGLWPFDASPGEKLQQSQWRPEYRTQLYRMFAREPGTSMISSKETRVRYGPWLYPGADPLRQLRDRTNAANILPDNSFQPEGAFGLASEIDLRSFEFMNNPLSTSPLELAVGGRFQSDGNRTFAHLSPLRENRPRDLETLSRDIVTVTAGGFNNTPDGDVDPDALLQASIDRRHLLTNYSGARSLTPTTVSLGSLTTLDDREVAVSIPDALAILTSDITERKDQARRQAKVTDIFRAAADATMPFASLRDANGGARPRNSVWYVDDGGDLVGGFANGEQKLFYGADRNFTGDFAYGGFIGNAGELSLRLTAQWTANLISLNRRPRTAIDPANPIHPDDRADDATIRDRMWAGVPRGSSRIAIDTNYFAYPGPNTNVNPLASTLGDSYLRYPRYPRALNANDLQRFPLTAADLENNLAYTDAVEFRYNDEVPPQLVPFRTRSEAYDRPVVMSLLIDEGFRNRMSGIMSTPTLLGPDELTRAYPGWSKGDVAQLGTLSPLIAAKLDLGEGGTKLKLCPADGTPPVNDFDTSSPAQRAVEFARLSARALNVYGIVPQPFITQAVSIMIYADTPPSSPDPGDGDGAELTGGGGSPGGNTRDPVFNPTIRAKVTALSQNPDANGDLLPAAGQRGFPDHIVEVFGFQLHNPFDVPISLSAIRDIPDGNGGFLRGRTLPDQTRRKVRQDIDRNTGRVGQEIAGSRLPKPAADTILSPSLEETRYYIEFGGRYYAMVGTDALGEDRRAITLEPGETRWFYVTDNDLDKVWERMNNADPNGMRGVLGSSPEATVEDWITNQLATNEPLGMSYVSGDTGARTGMANLSSSIRMPGDPTDTSIQIKNPRTQPTFQNPPTRLLRINPRTMTAVEPLPQPIPDSGPARRRFFDNRRAVRLWRVNRDIDLNDNRAVNDPAITSEGQLPDAQGRVLYRGAPNMISNDQLVDVLRDPKPWRRKGGDPVMYENDTEANWTNPTLNRRLTDQGAVKLYGDFPANPTTRTGREHDGFAIINWGSIRRPSDPKLNMPLLRDTPGDDRLLPEVPLGVLPSYCLEVKSSLPYRAGLPLDDGMQSPYAVRSSLNWDLVNGRRRLTPSMADNAEPGLDMGGSPFAELPNPDLFPAGQTSRANASGHIDYPRIATADNNPALGRLMKRGLAIGEASRRPVRLHTTINLPPQLQDIRDDGDLTSTTNPSHEPRFNGGLGGPLKPLLRDRLEFKRNRSGLLMSQLYMKIPMMLPPVHRVTDRSVQVPEMRPADLLMIPAVGPYEIPLDNTGRPWQFHAFNGGLNGDQFQPRDHRIMDMRWTTLAEAAAQALDFDFDESWRADNGGQDQMPADYRIGGRLYDVTAALPTNPALVNTELDGCLDRGCFRTDGFVAYIDRYDFTGARAPDSRFTPPRQTAVNGPLVGDVRPGNGVPMALNLLDQFRTHKFGSKNSMVQGTVNLNTAPLSVKRTLPMLSPDVRGWMASFGGGLGDYGTSGAQGGLAHFDPLGTVWERDLYQPLQPGSLTIDEQRQARSLYTSWLETADVGATLEAYSTKNIVTTRPVQIAGNLNRRVGIDVSFRSDMVDYRGQVRAPRLGEPELGRAFQSGIHGLREATGFASIGEILCARQGAPYSISPNSGFGIQAFNNPDDRYKIINNFQDLNRDLGTRGIARGLDYYGDVSIDRFARDGARLAPATAPDNLGIDVNNLGYYGGKPLQGVLSGMSVDKLHQRGPEMPTAAADTLEEKYVLANAALGTVSVRSDVFCVHFVVRGYSPTDVTGLAPEDPMIPSVERRYVMVVDRSNVTTIEDKPKVLFVQEVPMR